MTNTGQFQQEYAAIQGTLKLDVVGSPQYDRLLALWLSGGSPRPIDLFLIVNAFKTRDMDDDDNGESEAATILD